SLVGIICPIHMLRAGWVLFIAFAIATLLALRSCLSEFDDPDPSCVIIDEVCGMWLALLVADAKTLPSVLRTFILFRIFDILKPFPVKSLERLPGAFGVLAHDLAAGSIAGLLEKTWKSNATRY
ncbi:MAG: phosphatidylglycerophosphatase A, partial [Candidatus Wallbacteria bacterium]|nr:phosphatidylglycerophosphatase A [Candidatus Wallbacteria bacterium]